ncbi:uncharacterized protein F5147DRAFT_659583 [Suillus discolor]|uniref:Uncharacterized protein n=1 Tax=Suillus discolor TaxID=1912936 RepID=A0A9P7JLA0_9AGAM|nr:uncharacterized protein F5147DRAFT_659583 [Suillus discolor]KAG2085230.1 hypothetical protein F5147DRAFT_659583 [Suillus discolor]
MLTASPSPSPEPEERPQDGGDTSTNDTTLNDVAQKEPEESVADRIDHAWAAVLNTMHVCIDTSPPSKPELLEEQECWLRDWNTVMSNMTSVFHRAHAAEMHLSLNDVDAVTLAGGKIAAWMLTRAMKTWKEKAEGSAGKAKRVVTTEKTVEKAMEKLVATKNKGRTPAVLKCKVPPSVQMTAPDAGESEVEMWSDSPRLRIDPVRRAIQRGPMCAYARMGPQCGIAPMLAGGPSVDAIGEWDKCNGPEVSEEGTSEPTSYSWAHHITGKGWLDGPTGYFGPSRYQFSKSGGPIMEEFPVVMGGPLVYECGYSFSRGHGWAQLVFFSPPDIHLIPPGGAMHGPIYQYICWVALNGPMNGPKRICI